MLRFFVLVPTLPPPLMALPDPVAATSCLLLLFERYTRRRCGGRTSMQEAGRMVARSSPGRGHRERSRGAAMSMPPS